MLNTTLYTEYKVHGCSYSVKSDSLQLYPMKCYPPGFGVHGIFRQEYWCGFPFPYSRGSSWPRDWPASLASPELASIVFTNCTLWEYTSVRFSSVTQLCPTLCEPMDYSTAGLPVHHQLSEFTQIHVHWFGDVIQPSHPLSSLSPPALNLTQQQGFFQISQFFASGSQSFGVSASASVLPMNIQDWFPLGWTGWIPLQSKGLSRVFSNTTLQKHQFFGTQLFL